MWVVALRTVALFHGLVLMGFLQRGYIGAVAIKAKRRRGAMQMVDSLRLRRWFALVRGVTRAAAHLDGGMLRRFCQDFSDWRVAPKTKIGRTVSALSRTFQQMGSG